MNGRWRHFLPKLIGGSAALLLGWLAGGASRPALSQAASNAGEAQTLAGEVLEVIHGAVGRAPTAADAGMLHADCLGVALADYASNPGADPVRYESTRLAARRILANETAATQGPEETSQWLKEAAARLEVRATAAPALLAEERRDLVRRAQLARFHAERLIAAVRYNLFRRGLSLAELYAATQQEKRAVEHWRQLVAGAGAHPLEPRWREELRGLEAGLRDLEGQCCPPTPQHLAAPIWQAPR